MHTIQEHSYGNPHEYGNPYEYGNPHVRHTQALCVTYREMGISFLVIGELLILLSYIPQALRTKPA